jgi:thiaminase/transcriptional activator TenA
MVREIAAGTLPKERFRGYFEQNIAYLEEYARSLAHVAAASPDSAALEVLTELLSQIVATELPANRGFLERLGGDPGAVRGVATMEPTTYAYTRHLLAATALKDCACGLTAVLPCQWSYCEIGSSIGRSKPEDAIFRDWIGVFANAEYEALLERATGLLDRLGATADDAQVAEMTTIFDASTRYEIEFWDMAYKPLKPLP